MKRFPCLNMASTQCLWSLVTPNWSCSIHWGRKAPSLDSYRRTSPEGCITFVLRYKSTDVLLEQVRPLYPKIDHNHILLPQVQDINAAIVDLKAKNIRTLSAEPRIGAHGKPVMFLHPKDCDGVLVELEEA